MHEVPTPAELLKAQASMLTMIDRRREATGDPMYAAYAVHAVLALDEARLLADCTPERMSEAFEAVRR